MMHDPPPPLPDRSDPNARSNRSSRLGGGNIPSPIYPTQYPLAPSSSLRRNPTSSSTASRRISLYSMSMLSSHDISSSIGMRDKPAYEAPKFKTFQERKKEKDRALALAAGREWVDPDLPKQSVGGAANGSGMMQRSMNGGNSSAFTDQHQMSYSGQSSGFNPHNPPYRPSSASPTPPSRSSSSSGHRSNVSLGNMVLPGPGVPLAPQNIGNLPQPPSTPLAHANGSGFKPLPSPGGGGMAGGIARQTSLMSLNGSYERSQSPLPQPESEPRQMRHQASQPVLGRFGNFAQPPLSPAGAQGSSTKLQGRGLPSTPGMDGSGRPLPKPITSLSSTLESIPEPSTFSPPPATPHSASSSSCNSTSSPTIPGLPMNPSFSYSTDHDPSWSPQYPPFDRSETVSSVKSLDRFGMTPPGPAGARRPLPAPPVGVGSSRSLDRGVGGGGGARSPNRSPGPERDQRVDDGAITREMENMRMSARTPRPVQHLEHIKEVSGGNIVPSPAPSTPTPSITIAAPIPVPILNLPNGEDEEPADRVGAVPPRTLSPAPGFSVTLVEPMNVESSDTRANNIPVINVPTFSFPDDQDDEPSSSSTIPSISLPGEDSQSSSTSSSAAAQPRVKHTGPGIFCERCDGVIIGRIVTAMNKRWHPECFRCTTCRTLLEHVSSYEHEGQAYCHMDYHDQFAPKCHYCETAIVDNRFITIDDPTLGQRSYHELHFFCGECGDPFLDPSKSSAAGTEFVKREGGEEDDQTKDFVIHGKHAFCVECDVKLHKPKCRGCRKPIRDDALGALGGKWHKECFRCDGCDEVFATNTFFPIGGAPFCQDCYTQEISTSR